MKIVGPVERTPDAAPQLPSRRRDRGPPRSNTRPKPARVGSAPSPMSRVIILIAAAALSSAAALASHSNSTVNGTESAPTNQVYKAAQGGNSSALHIPIKSSASLLSLESKQRKLANNTNNHSDNSKPVPARSPQEGSPPNSATTTAANTTSTQPAPVLATPSTATTTTATATATATATSTSTTTTTATSPLATRRSRKQAEKRFGGNFGSDLAASSSAPTVSTAKQPKRSSKENMVTAASATSSGKWTHFGARLKPLTGAQSPVDHHHVSASVHSAALDSAHNQPRYAQTTSGRSVGVLQMEGNSVEQTRPAPAARKAASEDDDDEDDLDSEALLYKMMQQQSFLMNPNFQQEQQPARGDRAAADEPSGQLQHRAGSDRQAAGQGSAASRPADEEMAKSRRVIKLLKSYSHIHQVDDSDDQIRGSYARYPRPQKHSSAGNQYVGQQRPKSERHIFISSRPVSTSQTRSAARVYLDQDDGQYRPETASRADASSSSEADGGPGPNGSGGPPAEEEDEFECPNNGIFADVASGCQAYHVCQSASQVQQRFQCPLGTLFNDLILTCDFAHNVQCGKKAGEPSPSSGGAASGPSRQPADVRPQQQSSQNYNQKQTPRQQQAPAENVYSQPRQQHQQPPQYRPPAPGPRHLIIGTSPYNLHNQQRAAQSQVLNAYPSIRPLSNSIGNENGNSNSNNNNNNDNNNNSDDDDDKEDNEPLVPATLPPRASLLPYQPPPPPPPQSTTPSEPVMSSFRPVNPIQQMPSHRKQQPAARAQAQHPRPRYQPSEGGAARGHEASASTPTFLEPGQHSPNQETNRSPGAQSEDLQSYSLVINHMAAPGGSSEQLQRHLTSAASNSLEAARQQHAKPAGQRLTVASKQLGQQNLATTTPARPGATAYSAAAHHHPQTPQRQPIARGPALPAHRHESRREPARLPARRAQQQHQAHHQPAAFSAPANYPENLRAASQPAVSHQNAEQPAGAPKAYARDTFETNALDGREPEIDDVINDGMFLIIRHSANTPLLQLNNDGGQGQSAAQTSSRYANEDRQQSATTNSKPTLQVPLVNGPLPPMKPPAPQPHDQHHHNDQKQVQKPAVPRQYSSEQLVPSASSAPTSTESAPVAKAAATSVQTTTNSPHENRKLKVKTPNKAPQTVRIKRARKVKAAPQAVSVGAQQTNSTTTGTAAPASTAATPTTAGAVRFQAKEERDSRAQ